VLTLYAQCTVYTFETHKDYTRKHYAHTHTRRGLAASVSRVRQHSHHVDVDTVAECELDITDTQLWCDVCRHWNDLLADLLHVEKVKKADAYLYLLLYAYSYMQS